MCTVLSGGSVADVMQPTLQSLLWTIPTNLNRTASSGLNAAKQQQAAARLHCVAACAWDLLLELALSDAPVFAAAPLWTQKLGDTVAHGLHGSEGATAALVHLLWVRFWHPSELQFLLWRVGARPLGGCPAFARPAF